MLDCGIIRGIGVDGGVEGWAKGGWEGVVGEGVKVAGNGVEGDGRDHFRLSDNFELLGFWKDQIK